MDCERRKAKLKSPQTPRSTNVECFYISMRLILTWQWLIAIGNCWNVIPFCMTQIFFFVIPFYFIIFSAPALHSLLFTFFPFEVIALFFSFYCLLVCCQAITLGFGRGRPREKIIWKFLQICFCLLLCAHPELNAVAFACYVVQISHRYLITRHNTYVHAVLGFPSSKMSSMEFKLVWQLAI